MTKREWPILGCGVGLRSEHYELITQTWPRMDWFETLSENYMDSGGRPLHILEQVRARRIRPLLDRALPLNEAADAHRLIAGNQVAGNIVLLPWAA